MLPMTKKISPYNHSDGNDIKYIVIHSTGNGTDTAVANANYFNGGDRQASAHYFVDNNSIYQVVKDTQAAWHCGDGHMAYGIGNHNSIGIEMCETNGTIADATINNTIELVKSLMNKYDVGINNVVRHYDASRKCCPAPWSANNWSKWLAFKAKLKASDKPINPILKAQIQALQYNLNVDYNAKLELTGEANADTYSALKGIEPIIKKGHKSSVIKWMQQKLTIYNYLGGGQDTGIYDEPTFQAVTNMQKKWERATSGIMTPETWQIFLEN